MNNTMTIYRLVVDGSYIDYYTREKQVLRIAAQYQSEGKTVEIVKDTINTTPVSFQVL